MRKLTSRTDYLDEVGRRYAFVPEISLDAGRVPIAGGRYFRPTLFEVPGVIAATEPLWRNYALTLWCSQAISMKPLRRPQSCVFDTLQDAARFSQLLASALLKKIDAANLQIDDEILSELELEAARPLDEWKDSRDIVPLAMAFPTIPAFAVGQVLWFLSDHDRPDARNGLGAVTPREIAAIDYRCHVRSVMQAAGGLVPIDLSTDLDINIRLVDDGSAYGEFLHLDTRSMYSNIGLNGGLRPATRSPFYAVYLDEAAVIEAIRNRSDANQAVAAR